MTTAPANYELAKTPMCPDKERHSNVLRTFMIFGGTRDLWHVP